LEEQAAEEIRRFERLTGPEGQSKAQAQEKLADYARGFKSR